MLNHFAAPHGSPGGTRHVELFGHMRGWEPIILAANRNLLTRQEQKEDDFFRTVWVFPSRAGSVGRIASWVSYAATSLVAGLRLRNVELVYASSPHLPAGLAGWVLARVKRTPLVVEVRDLWPQVLVDMGQIRAGSTLHRGLKLLERFLYRHADAVVVLAEGSAADVIADGAATGRVTFLPNGADPDDFAVDEERETVRRSYGMNSTTLLYAGAHGPANGLEFVLDAAAELASTNPELSLWLVGDGTRKDALRAAARERRLSNVVFRDPVPKREMPRLLFAADAGLHVLADVPLFRRGVSPNKVFDYMAAGLPVLTNTPGEVATLVEDAGAGLTVEPAGLAQGARQFAAAGADQRRRWGDNGRAYLATHRSRSILAGRLEELLDSLVAGCAPNGGAPAQRPR